MPGDIDVVIVDSGSISIVEPRSERAKAWVNRKVSDEGYQPAWPTLYVEARYLGPLLEAMREDGLVLMTLGDQWPARRETIVRG